VPLVHRRLGPGNMGLPHMRARNPVVAAAVVGGHIRSRRRLQIVSRHV